MLELNSFVGQDRFGGVQDTAADWHHPGKESDDQTGTRQPSSFCTTERNVSIKQIYIYTVNHKKGGRTFLWFTVYIYICHVFLSMNVALLH